MGSLYLCNHHKNNVAAGREADGSPMRLYVTEYKPLARVTVHFYVTSFPAND
ncbi:hypothetical protein E6C60_3167 [Paenibacillus algicola]|uniref:Uncharacterized protein n=1 Tax=Paenibacillus algicola TaxID=2565926 RepID=A0A4P8XMU2_9BACL|nr:hypothetical protein E6C60_3167 [Paenibacillus algicola]